MIRQLFSGPGVLLLLPSPFLHPIHYILEEETCFQLWRKYSDLLLQENSDTTV